MRFNKKQLTQEEFDKLSQLDRIEFRLRYKDMSDEIITSYNTEFINAFLYILTFGIIITLLTFIAFPGNLAFVKILYLTVLGLKISIVLWIICLAVDIYNYYRWIEFKKVLIKEYFVVIKGKNDKRKPKKRK